MLMRRALLAAIVGAFGAIASPAFAQHHGSTPPYLLGGVRTGGVQNTQNTQNTESSSSVAQVPFKGGCRIVNQPLYDDKDNVVAHRRVKECPPTPVLANCRLTNKPVYDDNDKVIAHQSVQQCPVE